MATNYRIYKQFAPALEVNGDPTWAQRQVWVAKLSSEDTVDEYEALAEAETRKAELESLDNSGRQFQIREVRAPEKGVRPTEYNTKSEIIDYMDLNDILYLTADTKATLLKKIEEYWR